MIQFHVFQKKNPEHKDQEEVDDIELIFSSDDNKDLMQEDLVSISDYEPWQAPGSSGTPVLVNFSSLPSEEQPPDEEIANVTGRREIKSCSSVIEKHTRFQHESTEDSDVVSENRYSNSFDQGVSLDLKEAEDIRRDESFDTFDNVSIELCKTSALD